MIGLLTPRKRPSCCIRCGNSAIVDFGYPRVPGKGEPMSNRIERAFASYNGGVALDPGNSEAWKSMIEAVHEASSADVAEARATAEAQVTGLTEAIRRSRLIDLDLPNVRFRLAQWMCLRHHGWGAHPVNGTRGCSFSEADQLLRSLVAWAAEPGNGDGPPLGVTE